jgi:hypothetical protein
MRKNRHKKTADRLPQSELVEPACDWSPPSVPASIKIDGHRWRAIGQGIRFAVYSNGTEVVKIPLGEEVLLQQLKRHGYADAPKTAAERHLFDLEHTAEVRDRLMNGMLPPALFGNPQIGRNGWVFQKRMTPLFDLLKTSGDDKLSKVVDGTILCIQSSVRWGALGLFFALPVDFGLDSRGCIVIMGLGGITFDREVALDKIKAKPWQSDISGSYMLPQTMRQYFVCRMEEMITEKFLVEEWGRDVSSHRTSPFFLGT